MHYSIRYGNKQGTPILHIAESINEGRVSPKGLAVQGMMKKKLDLHLLLNPNKRITVDLRASKGQIIAVGYLNGNYYETTREMWSGDSSYRTAFEVEWVQVYHKPPLTEQQFCELYKVKLSDLKEPLFHAHHAWFHDNLILDMLPKSTGSGDYLNDIFSLVNDELNDLSKLFETQLYAAMSEKDREISGALIAELKNIFQKYPIEFGGVSASDLSGLAVKALKKCSPKKKKKNKEQTFLRRIMPRVAEHSHLTDYALAKKFKELKYRNRRNKVKWQSKTIASLRKKL